MNRRISLAEPVTELKRVPIRENGEPLVDFLEMCPKLIQDSPRFHYKRETLLRKSVAEKLCQAADNLPKGYRFAVIEGWRPPHIQKRMYMGTWNRFKARHPDWSDVKLRRVVNRYTAPPNSAVPPPHSTGAAFDLVLADETGKPVDLISPYDRFDPACFHFITPGLSETALKHREIMAAALLPTGITNYPSEYWHWTYGDQGWAYRGGHEYAIYGPVEPENYVPNAADVSDEPLVLITE